ncbi:hypothetical protein [Amycolatopsis sp. GM8]|uniref:hypothetical protein n=1 Tax=Amycolatopsis sp. GM8 TaxID=2896530 RepID=UPI001F1C46DB|nr:hypothetical protein [Amycolatopsis sp. GM8]
MVPPEPRQTALAAADAALGAATTVAGICLRTAAPVVNLVPRPENWPAPLRRLAERGARDRQAAMRVFGAVAPVAVMDVLDRLDLAGIVRDVIDEIGLPELIRVSTGSVAGDAVRDARLRLMAADDTVGRWTGTVLRPRRAADERGKRAR